MSLIRLKANNVKAACIDTLIDLQELIQTKREPIIQSCMKGFLCFCKKTREQAIYYLERQSAWHDYNMIGVFWVAPTICPKIIDMCDASKDGYVYINDMEWGTFKKCYKEG